MSFLRFEPAGTSPSGLTKRWIIEPASGTGELGTVHWYAPWRKYVVEIGGIIYDANCLREVADFTEQETVKHRCGTKPTT